MCQESDILLRIIIYFSDAYRLYLRCIKKYFVPALVIQSKDKMTVPILIALLRGADYMNRDMGKIYMMILLAIVPIILVYLLLSKYIIAGVTLGGVKG